ncbi:4'-phosphopantetheinyl transferase family protein [Psychrobacter sp.]|uniref:4'-phosphopantetheinyl transferase family protein n=1 Tax=Psychrobacter sp. TaxID=56811 RepID=UPI003BAED528
MQNSNLYHIQYTQLDPMTWCATAQVSTPVQSNNLDLLSTSLALLTPNRFSTFDINLCHFKWHYQTSQTPLSVRTYDQRQQQRTGVRLLLQSLLNKLDITDSLDESDFPYRLINSQYYVCFSHTGASSKKSPTTPKHEKLLDTVENKVAVILSRHRAVGIDIEINDIAWHVAQRFYHSNELTILQKLPMIQRDHIVKLLWQIKESFIKIHQYKLAQGLGMDYSSLILNLINSIKEDMPSKVITDYDANYHIALLPSQQTIIIY